MRRRVDNNDTDNGNRGSKLALFHDPDAQPEQEWELAKPAVFRDGIHSGLQVRVRV
jgi:hypothetical protein